MFAEVNSFVDDGIELSLIRGMRPDFHDFIVATIAEGIARQVMCLDALGKVLVLEIDGGITGIVDAEVDTDGVAVMEHGRFVADRIGDVKRGHQTVGRGEIIAEEALLPKVVLRHAVVIALQCRAFLACEVMVERRLLE